MTKIVWFFLVKKNKSVSFCHFFFSFKCFHGDSHRFYSMTDISVLTKVLSFWGLFTQYNDFIRIKYELNHGFLSRFLFVYFTRTSVTKYQKPSVTLYNFEYLTQDLTEYIWSWKKYWLYNKKSQICQISLQILLHFVTFTRNFTIKKMFRNINSIPTFRNEILQNFQYLYYW